MPDNRLSRLFKAKLLRRSSSPTVPHYETVTASDPKSKSSTSFVASHLYSPDEKGPKTHPFSTVSFPVDHPSSEEISGPTTGTGSTADQGPIADHIGISAQAKIERPSDSLDQSSTTDRVRNARDSSSTPELATSPPHTPLTPASPPVTPPVPAPEQAAASSLQGTTSKVRAHPAGPTLEPQPTTSLNTVVENRSSDATYPPFFPPSSLLAPPASSKRPSLIVRRQSLLPQSQQHLVGGLLEPGPLFPSGDQPGSRMFSGTSGMLQRKIWVKRPGGSATLVPALNDAVVDELRDQVIIKYCNSLGRSFDSPDIVIRISPRDTANKQVTPERILGPEEPLISVIDAYYPGGQRADEALIIDIPQRRTPKPSPRHSAYYQPAEHGDYFTLVPANQSVSTPPTHTSSASGNHQAPSISILSTGMAPPLPSPGSRATRRRPPITRHTTNSPTMLGQTPAKDTNISTVSQPAQQTPPLPTPPLPPPEPSQNKANTPPRPASPRAARKSKKTNEPALEGPAFGGVVEGTVPPINVLIVEDNIINQKLLEAFMKRLSVRWKCAANGEEAVRKWREGGFHLVLMDIQLPVMNGLDATKEIRRLERLNGIGVFPKTADGRSSAANGTTKSPEERGPEFQPSLREEDTLADLSLFKSPVIIVALTASSLQSDRHEALAAGCNDFLTKPIGFPWLEQKVTEWGCMQALIDFEGWRKWRGFVDSSSTPTATGVASPMQGGDQNQPEASSPGLPKAAAAKPDGAQDGTDQVAHGPRPTDTTIRGDSSISGGSGSTGDSLDSPGQLVSPAAGATR
ncbi:response regulator [Aspergillus sclerotialis]|uniref:Response regulator n=1 Tax=Aspergillus sclerotialis TaxID=2070753 RepID=A0A3A2ZAU5_9EURO|nr:response regulator [Aspergillus sclerotialis]